MKIQWLPFLILAFASYRLTRILIIDTIFEGTRGRVHQFLLNQAQKEGKLSGLWFKLLDLSSCTWCTGVWVSFLIYSIYLGELPSNRFEWLTVAGIAGVQGMLHAVEPEGDHDHQIS